MGSDNEMESDSFSEDSGDDIVEDLETENGNKRGHSYSVGIEGKDEDGDFGESKSKKIKFSSEKEMKKLSKPATAEELNRLRETENLFHSNLFRLQIEEILKEVNLKQKYRNDFQTWFEKFHASIMKLEDCGERHNLHDTEWLKPLKVKLPIPALPQTEKGIYQFRKPLRIEVVGSYSLDTLVGPNVTVDVILELPRRFYHKDDFVNGSYHHKRALYLCDLISHIQNLSELVEDVNFMSDGIDILKPKIEIIPSGRLAKCIKVLLNVIIERQGMNLSKFNPDRSNVMAKVFFNHDVSFGDSGADSATPFYNSTILSDLTLMDNYKFVFNQLQPHKNIRDGIILLKVWLRQRELTSGLGDFSGFLVAALVSYLLKIRKLSSFMSSYQVVRTVFNYLVSSDWMSNGITLSNQAEESNIPSFSAFHEHHKVVFVDVTGYYNLCYGMHPSTFQQIKQEAKMALSALDDPTVNSFQILFMTSVPFYRHFDHVFTFHNGEALQNAVEIYGLPEEKLNYCGAFYPHLISMVYEVLKKGFRKRVNCFYVRQPQKNRWKAHKKFRYFLNMSFGLNLNPENYYLAVDKAEESETSEFREFWGDRSELRRFQDSTITETVVWNAKTFSEKRLICKQIVTYLMKSKFGLDNSDFQYIADQFDHFITKSHEESAMRVLEAFDSLSKELRNLKNLPLNIVAVQGASPVFRYTEVAPLGLAKADRGKEKNETENGILKGKKSKNVEKVDPQMTAVPAFVNPIQVVVQMGATNKWPQDLGAIKRLRTAFYLKIAQSLVNQCRLKAVAFTDRVELLKEGFLFHIKIFCPYEIGCLKQIVEDGIIKYRDNDLSLEVEKNIVFLPKLSSILHGLYEQYTSFGPACCIVKRWVNSQMIDGFHISEEVLEMLVASLYLKSTVHEIPQQPQTAFLRFLYLMARTDWNAEYIVLNFNNELNREDLLEIESHFADNRDTLPALFIATPYDRKKSTWTRDCPTPLILLRLVQLCGNVMDFVERRIYQNLILTNEFRVLFEPSIDPYDVIIRLNENFIPRLNCIDDYVCDDETQDTNNPIPVNGFDPVSIYVKELRDSYNDVALFFYNTYGGTVIGVLWKPGALEPKEFKVSNMPMHTYNASTKKLHLEKELIIEDFLILGKRLVKSIDLRENGSVKTYNYL